MRRVILWTVLGMCFAACGAVNRQIMLEERENPGDMMSAIHAASVARGFDARLQEERQVSFYLDRELGTRLFFQAKRRGVVLVVRTSGGEEVPVEQTESELQRAEQVGREIMQEARVVFAQMEQTAIEVERAEALEEQREDEQRAREREARQANQADLANFMDDNRRRAANNQTGVQDSAPAEQSGSSGGSSARCCINGAYYECPSAASLDQCAGRFSRCVSACGMTCMEECLQTDPPDPSGCTRVPTNDGDC